MGSDSASSSSAVSPPLIRRSSFEPLRLGLGSLPPPVFTRAPPGQRSVPAIEFLVSKEGNAAAAAAAFSSLPSVQGSALTTPISGLGNGAMSVEPWNLWSDASAPTGTASTAMVSPGPGTIGTVHSAESGAAADAIVRAPNQADDELASALAASVVLDADKQAKRLSKSSMATAVLSGSITPGSSAGTVLPATSWPEEFVTSSNIPPQSFALDPTASPSSSKLKPVASSGSVGGTGGAGSITDSSSTAKSSLIPRNVSFSTLLDLPTSSNAAGTESGSLSRQGSLSRKTTLNQRSGATGASGASRTSLFSGGLGGAEAGPASSLPSLSFTSSAASLYPAPGSSYGSSSTQREGPPPPEQLRAPSFGQPNQVGRGNNLGNGLNNNLYSRLGADLGHSSDGNEPRSRQPSAFSDISVTSVPFGSFFTQAPTDSFGPPVDGTFASFGGTGNASIFAGETGRRDSGYGLSIYNPSPPTPYGAGLNRRASQPAWGVNAQFGSPQVGRNASFSYSPSQSVPFGLSPDPSYGSVGMGSSPSSGASSTSSLYRYSGGTDFLSGATSAPNYGLGLVGPASPYVGLGANAPWDRPREERSRPIRSPLLEEFRADKTRRWTIKDMTGHIAEFMCDQVGSRYIQEHILEHPTSEDCDLIYEEVCPVILQLSIDVFANFCVQRLLEKASTEQIQSMANALKGSILRLALQTYGCRVIQKAIEVVSPECQLMIIRELEGAVQKCVRDQNANHVIQKVIQTVPADQLQHIVDAFVGHVYTFATHPYSCRVLQRILENCPERMTRPLLEELKSYAQNLMQDQYGNYVVQFVIEKGLPMDRSDIVSQIYGQVLHLSKHKFASNVIEKCIMNATEPELQMIAAEVLAPRVDGTTGVTSMLRHEYANYPLQRLIKHTTGAIHRAIVEQVSAQLAMFRHANPPFSAKHLVAVEKLLYDLEPNGFPSLYPRRFEDHYVSSQTK